MVVGYVKTEEARQFLTQRYGLTGVDDNELSRSLYLAFDKIETLPIRDSGKSETQETNFPRVGEKEVPGEIKKAQIIEAYNILTKTQGEKDQEVGIASKTIGDMSVTYNTSPLNPSNLGKTSMDILKYYIRRTF